MKSYPVGEFKSNFSKVLEYVKNGEKIGILFGKDKKQIAMIVPISKKSGLKRKVGILNGKIKIKFATDFSISEEEFISIQ